MNTENSAGRQAPNPGGGDRHFNPPQAISLDKARKYVQNFRKAMAAGHVDPTNIFGIYHYPDESKAYMDLVYENIKKEQENLNGPLDKYHEWSVGFFFMLDDNGKLGFCVAPTVVEKNTGNEAAVGGNIGKNVWDPFDTDKYNYTYGIKNENPANNFDIYDMGEMWP